MSVGVPLTTGGDIVGKSESELGVMVRSVTVSLGGADDSVSIVVKM